MDISKLQDAITELEAEAERCKRLASELRGVVERSTHGSGRSGSVKSPVIPPRAQQRLNLRHREQKSVRTLALEILRAHPKPMHVDDLVRLINEQRTDPTSRSAVESQLSRSMEKLGVKRTAPGTFTVKGED